MIMEQADATFTIKKIHSVLRRDVKNGGDAEKIWQDHKANKSNLQCYSNAMTSLANIWENSQPLSESRVEWCMVIFREYFWNGGLQKSLEKELRKAYYDLMKTGTMIPAQSLECFLRENQSYFKDKDMFCDQRLKVLDVGSCYNPFRKFVDEITVIPIDIHPATDEVYQGDFLELEIIEDFINGKVAKKSFMVNGKWMVEDMPLSPIEESSVLPEQECIAYESKMENIEKLENVNFTGKVGGKTHPFQKDDEFSLSNSNAHLLDIHKSYLENPLKKLPSESFDVLVFSLVLSYLPTQKQRWDCCVKANRLLCDNGLLILIESDSAHQQRNAHQIRAWKRALESIGFARYRYEKLTHLHCMAFRKKRKIESLIKKSQFVDNSLMMFIPQDFHEEESMNEQVTSSIRTNEQDKQICQFFNLLPESV